MSPFKTVSEAEVERINRIQRRHFDKLYHLFEPPLPEGVAERLAKIVAAGRIAKGASVLDVGSGTGILIPLIHQYEPGRIYACDLSEAMLRQINKNYSGIQTIQADVRDLKLPDGSLDVVFINACYPNIVDKAGAFANIGRMIKTSGRMVISHPLGKKFVCFLKENAP